MSSKKFTFTITSPEEFLVTKAYRPTVCWYNVCKTLISISQSTVARWLYCVECPQYSAQSARLSVRLSKWVCIEKITLVKVIWHKAHRPRRRMVQSYLPGGGNVFSHKGTLAPFGEYNWTCASFGDRSTQAHNPNCKSSVQLFCTAHGRKSLYLTVSK